MKKGPVTPKGVKGFLPLKTSRNTRVGLFVDEANIFYIQKELGWKIDWNKLINLLKGSLDLKFARYYLGMPSGGQPRLKNIKLKKRIESYGYTVVTKPLKKIYINKESGKFKYKCNFDVEMALDVASFLDQLDLVVVVSSDSDFVAVRDFVLSKDKSVMFMCFERRIAWEILRSKHLLFENIKTLVEFKK